jgi:hypothetical protein
MRHLLAGSKDSIEPVPRRRKPKNMAAHPVAPLCDPYKGKTPRDARFVKKMYDVRVISCKFAQGVLLWK